jgi:hypothetical protein
MSDVEKYYATMQKYFPQSRPWHELHPQEQMMIVQAINMTIQVLTSHG